MNANQEPTDPRPDEIGDKNIERLLGDAYRPESPDPEFVQQATAAMHAAAAERQAQASTARGKPRLGWRLMAWAAAASVLIALGIAVGTQLRSNAENPPMAVSSDQTQSHSAPAQENPTPPPSVASLAKSARSAASGLTARPRPAARKAEPLAIGGSLETGPRAKRRAVLPDGSILFLNEDTAVTLEGSRQVKLQRGEVFVEVDHQAAPFLVKTPGREVVALGTKFDARLTGEGTGVTVTQGKVRVSGVAQEIEAGQELAPENRPNADSSPPIAPAPRASHRLAWTKDLLSAAAAPLVPASKYAGGALVTVDPSGQESRLSLRKYHVDVYIEDGFARTTIDQTFFNHYPSRLEGTFCFPLPADASLSRLAMYVNGKLMEGGMAERQHAREVFEDIVRRQKDPALLEWIDGTTFRMRVFPLEGRQEKRIVLSYTQRLAPLYDRSEYRFPAGHTMQEVDRWSCRVLLKGGKDRRWTSDSHEFRSSMQDRDLVLEAEARHMKPDRDVVLTLLDPLPTAGQPHHVPPTPPAAELPSHPLPSPETGEGLTNLPSPGTGEGSGVRARWSTADLDSHRYLALRWRPELPGPKRHPRRDWVFLFERSADRDPLLARVQVEVIRTLLENAERDDTFSILTAGTQTELLTDKPLAATPENIKEAVARLEKTHLVGALDLERAFAAVRPILESAKAPCLVHVGSGVPVLGEKDVDALVKRLPERAPYVGVGVGRRWSRTLMRAAAARTGGYCTQINPDEQIAWRAFDLLSTLNAPRLLNVRVIDKAERLRFLCDNDWLAQGEELFAVARMAKGEKPPEWVEVSGLLDGKRFSQRVPHPLPLSRPGRGETVAPAAGYLPRTWAKLEIDRLVAEGAEKNRGEIVPLSMAMYVMSPFTSLLVLENEEMYVRYGVDRGRKDHWAMYPCPEQIQVVTEPEPAPKVEKVEKKPEGKRELEELLKTVRVRLTPPLLNWPRAPQMAESRVFTLWDLHNGVHPVSMVLAGGRDMRMSLWWDVDNDGDGVPDSSWRGVLTDELAFGDHDDILMFRRGRQRAVVDALYAIERSYAPFPNEPPIVYPDAEVWRQLTARRKERYWSMDLASRGPAERRIIEALRSPTQLDFVQTPLADVVNYLEDYHKINIQFDRRALDATGLTTDAAVTRNLSGVSLRSALRLVLRDLGLTYVVQDGTLLITTPEQAANRLETRVYPVADLVLPVDGTAWAWGEGLGRGYGGAGFSSLGFSPSHNFVDLYGQNGQVGGFPGVVRLNTWDVNDGKYGVVGLQPGLDFSTDGRLFVGNGFGGFSGYGSGIGRPTQSLMMMVQPRIIIQEEEEERLGLVDWDRAPDWSGRFLGFTGPNTVGLHSPAIFTAELDIPQAKAVLQKFGLKEQPSLYSSTPPHPLFGKVLAIKENGQIEISLGSDDGLAKGHKLHVYRNEGGSQAYMGRIEIVDTSVERANCRVLPEFSRGRIQAGDLLASRLDGDLKNLPLLFRPSLQWPASDDGTSVLAPTFFERPQAFSDLVAYAPAMNTTAADVAAVIDGEMPNAMRPKQGQIDDQARRLIERARGAGWQRVTFFGPRNTAAWLDVDGAGRYRYERTTAHGLQEMAVCDGKTLVHWYPELGVGSRRTVSRFHRAELAAAVPWMLSPVDEMARGADITAVDDHTVALTPSPPTPLPQAGEGRKKDAAQAGEGRKDGVGDGFAFRPENGGIPIPRGGEKRTRPLAVGEPADGDRYAFRQPMKAPTSSGKAAPVNDSAKSEPVPCLAVHLVLDPAGRLAERRYVEMPAKKTLVSQTYGADGTVRWLDAAGKTLSEWKLAAKPCEVPNLTPDLDEMVLLPMPLRTSEQVLKSRNLKPETPDSQLSKDDALALLAANLGDPNRTAQLIGRRFFTRGDRRMGFYTLLMSSGYVWTPENEVSLDPEKLRMDPLVDHPGRPLARYVVACLQRKRDGLRQPLGSIGGTPEGFLQQLAEFHDLWQAAARGPDNAEIDRACRFLRSVKSPALAWALWKGFAGRGENQLAAAMEEIAPRLAAVPGLGIPLRFEQARWTIRRGDVQKGEDLFRKLYSEAADAGLLLPICPDFRQAMAQGDGSRWTAFVRQTGDRMVAAGARATAMRFAWMIHQQGFRDLAQEVFLAARSTSLEKEPAWLTLAAVEYLASTGQNAQADEALRPLLSVELADEAAIWRLAALLAHRRGMLVRAAECLDRAVEIQCEEMPETFDVQAVRTRYAAVLDAWQRAATAASGSEGPSARLVDRVVRAADRWRSLDSDPSTACQAAARILADLGATELAWAYLTTPSALQPDRPPAWQATAQTFRTHGHFDLADRAYQLACQSEPGNAQLLWERILLLQEAGRMVEARSLARTLAAGRWDGKYADLAARAKRLAEERGGGSVKEPAARKP